MVGQRVSERQCSCVAPVACWLDHAYLGYSGSISGGDGPYGFCKASLASILVDFF